MSQEILSLILGLQGSLAESLPSYQLLVPEQNGSGLKCFLKTKQYKLIDVVIHVI